MRRCSMATVRSCAFPPSSGAIERLDMTGTMARSLEHLRLWLRYERLRAAARRSLEHLRLWLRYERLRAAARRSCRQQGFTLIELLLAIGVMALLAVLSWRGLDGMVRAQETTRQRADEMLVLQAALGQWGSDLDALLPMANTTALDWDGQVLRMTRRSSPLPPQRRRQGPVAALAIAAGAHTRAVAAGLAAGGPMGAHPGCRRAALRGRAAAAGRLADLLLPGRGLVQPLVQRRLGQQFRRHPRRPAPANHLAGQPGAGRPAHARLGQPGARREALMRPPGLRASPGLRRRARGAALLLAMLTVTLVATFAAAAMWQQWRAVEIESAERARVQSAWILVGALDWSRLILFEDKRSHDATDHLPQPWAVPLQEARLSTFLAADRNVTQMQDASTDTTEAFLSGAVSDLQGRLNIGNLFQGGRVQPLAQRQFGRLFARLGLSDQQLNLLVDGMREAQ